MRSVYRNRKHHPGAQPGNTDRSIHGRYSRRLARHLTAATNSRATDDPQVDIFMARVHLVQLLTAQKKAPPRLALSYERAVIDCLGLIVSLISVGVRRKRHQPDMDRALTERRSQTASDSYLTPWDSNLIRTAAYDEADHL